MIPTNLYLKSGCSFTKDPQKQKLYFFRDAGLPTCGSGRFELDHFPTFESIWVVTSYGPVGAPGYEILPSEFLGPSVRLVTLVEVENFPLKVGYTHLSVRKEEHVFVCRNLKELWKDVGSWQIIYEHFDFLLVWDFSMLECIRMHIDSLINYH